MNPFLPLMIATASGGLSAPKFVGTNKTFESANNTAECAIIFKTDGKIYELDNVTETERGNWLFPPGRAGSADFSIYFLSNGMETGDTEDTWLSVGDVERKFGITSAGLTRANTVYYSYGVRSGSTLGSFDHSHTATLTVPV